MSRRSVEIVMIMRRIANLQRQAIATVILLAMLIAPLCAPLCGSRVCANSSTQAEDCHSSVTAETQQTNLGAARACALGELPTAALNETTSSRDPLKQVFTLHISPQFLLAAHAEQIAANSALPGPDNEAHKNSSTQAAVLRI
jgi:hypothetical protein